MPDAPPPDRATCSLCGTTESPVPLTWIAEHGPRGITWICPGCARRHLRAIEAKLDQEYW